MKIFCDWIVKNEQKRIEVSLRSLLPYIDQAYLIDTGSEDDTIEIAHEVQKDFPHLKIITGIDIGVTYNISIARNMGLGLVPPEFWLNEDTWYGAIAGDEVYDESAANLRPILESMKPEVLWVYAWGRQWYKGEDGKPFIENPKFGRPTFYRHVDGMKWDGVWNRERIIYPNKGSYFPRERRNDRTTMYWDADLWYDHYGWADEKAELRMKIYTQLANREKTGEIPHPE